MNSASRDFIGYGPYPPNPKWPQDAYVAVQFVLNYEEGGESNVIDNDPGSETFLSEIYPAESFPNRHMSIESLFEYGSRSGVWRVLHLFERYHLPLTIFAVAQALSRNPAVAKYCLDQGHEIAAHGLRWKSYQFTDPAHEKRDMIAATEILTNLCGYHPYGWYTGRDSPQTHEILAEVGGYLYSSDSYADDLPYWKEVGSASVPQLIVPYALDTNDMRFHSPTGFATGEDFYAYLRSAFDILYAEGKAGQPKMLSIGLHCRIIGRPGRLESLQKFINYVASKDQVWITRRIDIARHWKKHFPYQAS